MNSKNPRRHITQLPAVLQTDTMAKYFAATVDHVFQPGKPERLSGYIGSQPSYYDPDRDFYVAAPTTERASHQLEPAMVSSADGNINDLLFYNDYINYLAMHNGNVTDHSRLFSNTAYSWAPPIDPDKISNYQQYYWFGADVSLLPAVEIASQTTEFVGDGTTTTFILPPSVDQVNTSFERVVAFVGRMPDTQFSRSGADAIVFTTAPSPGAPIILFRYGDLTHLISGQARFDPSPFSSQPVTALTSTMKVAISDARTLYAGWAKQPWNAVVSHDQNGMWEYPAWDTVAYDLGWVGLPWGANDAYTTFWVDGVGSSIVLTPVVQNDDLGNTTVYVTIDRRSNDGNPWSLHNYWVHGDAFAWSGQSFPALRALRPVIEFIPNIELYKYGTTRLDDITAVLTGDPYEAAQNFAPRPANDDIRWWDVLPWDDNSVGGFEPSALQSIPLADVNGAPLGSVWVDGQHSLVFGDRVLVIENDNPFLKNRIVTITKGAAGEMLLKASAPPSEGDIVRLRRDLTPWGADYAVDPWDTSLVPVEYYFNGTTWVEAPRRSYMSDPLFSLYTASNVRHEDLPSSTFVGNRLFGYATGVGVVDAVLNRPLAFDNNGEIQFLNDVAAVHATSDGAQINGYQFFRIVGTGTSDDVFQNDWFKYPTPTSQVRDSNGEWALPLNLTANPVNLDVGLITQAQWFPQLSEGIAAQTGFTGSAYGSNNWRDTTRALGLGRTMLQHASPLLKGMLLASNKKFDYIDAASFVDREYTRFRAKFVQQLKTMQTNGQLLSTDSPTIWVETALANLKTAKNNSSPFLLSQMAGGGFYIPATPASLGLFAPVRPEYMIDFTYATPIAFIVGHDGSRTPAFNDWRDAVMLTLEELIYNNIDPSFFADNAPVFDFWTYTGGRYRNKTTPTAIRYTASEVNEMYQPIFVGWAQTNRLDYMKNTGYDSTNPFTFNYHGTPDIDGNPCPGNWRAIYRYFFDTDSPFTRPWEMLGFASRPDWWSAEYGEAPYTSGNLHLWSDLRDGRVRRGGTAGVDSRFVRPDLLSILPVDEAGGLLDPIACGVVPHAPTEGTATRGWAVGDHGPVENLWMATPSFAFAQARLAFLMRPASWVEFAWDRGSLEFKHGQWLWADTQDRPRPSEVYVHGEVVNGVSVVKLGIQQWISDMMVSRAQVSSDLGTAMRGIDARLAHRMGGYTQSSNLAVLADNFGALPKEDVNVVFYQPPPNRQTFYSAIIIEWTGAGWRMVGYDAETQAFKTIPGDVRGPKTVINLGNAVTIRDWKPNVYYTVGVQVVYAHTVFRCATAHTSSTAFEPTYWTSVGSQTPPATSVTVCDNGLADIVSVPYGTVLPTYQAVASFIRDYFRWMENEGFDFEEPDANGNINGWNNNIQEFLKWSQINWQAGNFVALSPAATSLTFNTDFGTVCNVEQEMNGIYGLLDRTGRPILHDDAFVSRIGSTAKILVVNSDLYGARLQIGAIEHALVFSNTTIFGDIIYSPLLNLYQPRLKVEGVRSSNWNGRMEAPGYVISGGDMMENFQKTTVDLREMFDIEQADVPYLRNFARHNIGYQRLSYLENLLIAETEQFEFYQGMIQQKGAGGVFTALERSQFVDQSASLQFLEEWALQRGVYGAVTKTADLSFSITIDDISHDRQIIAFGETHADDGVIGLPQNDPRWIVEPPSPSQFRMLLTPVQKLPSAGNVRLDEINYTVRSSDDLPALYTVTQTGYFGNGSTVWFYDRGDGSYDVKQAFYVGNVNILVSKIETNTEDPTLGLSTRITFTSPHGLTVVDTGNWVYLPSTSSYTSPDLGGFLPLYVETTTTIILTLAPLDISSASGVTFTTPSSLPIYIMRSVRFSDIPTAQSFWSYVFPSDGQMMWIDNVASGRWGVYQWAESGWKIARQQPAAVDAGVVETARLFMNAPVITQSALTLMENPVVLPGMTVFHPLSGFIPGQAANELDFVCDSDPAQYYDVGSQWGSAQVGQLWWDTAAVKFLETELDLLTSNDPVRNQSSLDYRVNYWGKIAPGTSVNVYEWSRFISWPVDPSLTTSGSFLQAVEYDETVNGYINAYYTWILNPSLVPDSPGRSIPASRVAALINDPASSGLAWMTPISATSFIVSGIAPYLGSADSAMELLLSAPEQTGTIHNQFQLSRPDDEILMPDHTHWRALRTSLVGFDDAMQPAPSPRIPPNAALGIGPGQSMWPPSDRIAARRAFVTVVNRILGASNLASTNAPLAASLATSTPSFQNLIWAQTDSFSGLTPPPLNSFDFTTQSPQERLYLSRQTNTLTPPSVASLKRYPRILLTDFTSATPAWSIWEVETSSGKMSLATNYDASVATYAEMISGSYTEGTRVLVENDETASGFWVIYTYLPKYIGTNADGFFPTCIQTYNTSDFFSAVDWFSTGYSVQNPPIVSYATAAARDAAQGTEVVDAFVKIKNNGAGRWIWTQWNGTQWETVAIQNGTLGLSSAFYDPSRVAWGANYFDPAAVSNRDGTMELRAIFDILYANLTPTQLNQIYFTMLNFVFAHQNEVAWAFKTSFLSIAQYRERLAPTPIETPDNLDNLIAFCNDVKPYRVKLRDFIQSYMTDVDTATIHATDYDKPAYYDAELGIYRPLDQTKPRDLAILQTTAPWKDWLGVYLNASYNPSSASYNPVRRIKTTIRFDRIDPGSTPLQLSYGWDETPMDAFPFDDARAEIDAAPGALSRMLQYYNPGLGMRAADETIDFDLGFKGVGISGAPLAGGAVDDVLTDAPPVTMTTGPEKFADPSVEAGHPQEFAASRVPDALSLTVRSNWTLGAPTQRAAYMNVSYNSGATALDLEQIAASSQSVLTFIDGSLLPFSNVGYSQFSRTITTDIARPNTVLMAHSFGTSGKTAILDQRYYDGDGVATQFLLRKPAFEIDAVVDGMVVPASVSGDTVTFSTPPAAGANIMLTGYSGDDATHVMREALPYETGQTWILANPSTGTGPVPHFGTLVFVNGRALTPPTTRVFSTEEFRAVSFVAVADPTAFRVWVNGVFYTGIVGIAPPGTSPFSAQTMVNAGSFSAAPDFVISGTYFIINNPAISGEICIEHTGDGDFLIDGENLTISKALSSGDDIEVITFINADPMEISSQAFSGQLNGCYPIAVALPCEGSDYVLVSVDGIAQTPNIDFTIDTSPALNFDQTEFDQYPFDQEFECAAVQFFNEQIAPQTVVITAFSGDTAEPASMWSSETMESGLAIMGDQNIAGDWDNLPFDVQYDDMADQYATSSQGDRRVFKMNGTWNFSRCTDGRTGVLVNPVLETDTEITISLNPYGIASEFVPDNPFALPAGNRPGIIMINGERIEYFAMVQTGNSVVLSEMCRGTKNTRIGAEQRSFARHDGDGETVLFGLTDADATTAVEVVVWNGTSFEYLKQNVHYTVTQTGPNVAVTLKTAPPNSGSVTLAQTQANRHPVGTLVYADAPARSIRNPFKGAYDFAA